MKTRCTNPNAENYKRYGGKGIKYCEGLSDYDFFYKILGDPPTDKHSLDREDSSMNYSCGCCKECISNFWKLNVKWSTTKEQASNRGDFIHKITFNGITMNMQEWSEKLGIKRATLNNRINTCKWSIERAFNEPIKKKNRIYAKRNC